MKVSGIKTALNTFIEIKLVSFNNLINFCCQSCFELNLQYLDCMSILYFVL